MIKNSSNPFDFWRSLIQYNAMSHFLSHVEQLYNIEFSQVAC